MSPGVIVRATTMEPVPKWHGISYLWSAIGAKNQTMYFRVYIDKTDILQVGTTLWIWICPSQFWYSTFNFGIHFTSVPDTHFIFGYGFVFGYTLHMTAHIRHYIFIFGYTLHIRHSLHIRICIILHVRIQTSHSALTSHSTLSSYSETHFTLRIRHLLHIQHTSHSEEYFIFGYTNVPLRSLPLDHDPWGAVSKVAWLWGALDFSDQVCDAIHRRLDQLSRTSTFYQTAPPMRTAYRVEVPHATDSLFLLIITIIYKNFKI